MAKVKAKQKKFKIVFMQGRAVPQAVFFLNFLFGL
jgi:hypothetical protein